MKRIYVSEEAYKALAAHLLRTRGTTRGIGELASRIILEALRTGGARRVASRAANSSESDLDPLA